MPVPELSPELKVSLAGAGLSGLSVVIGMPFDNIKTLLQVDAKPSYHKTLLRMYQSGFSSFYKGTSSFVVQRTLKAGVRTPTMIYSKQLTDAILPQMNDFQKNIVVAFIVAIPDSLIVTPTDAVKVRVMTREKQYTFKEMAKEINSSTLFKDLRRAYGWTFSKTYLGWANFYTMRSLSQELLGENHSSTSNQLALGAATTFTKLAITTPPDVIKTHLQKSQRDQNNINGRAVITHLWKEFGWRKFFNGLGPRTAHSLMATLIGNYVLNLYDNLQKALPPEKRSARPTLGA